MYYLALPKHVITLAESRTKPYYLAQRDRLSQFNFNPLLLKVWSMAHTVTVQ